MIHQHMLSYHDMALIVVKCNNAMFWYEFGTLKLETWFNSWCLAFLPAKTQRRKHVWLRFVDTFARVWQTRAWPGGRPSKLLRYVLGPNLQCLFRENFGRTFWGVIELTSLEATCTGITTDLEQCSYDHYILFILIFRHLFAFTGLVVAGAIVVWVLFAIFSYSQLLFLTHQEVACGRSLDGRVQDVRNTWVSSESIEKDRIPRRQAVVVMLEQGNDNLFLPCHHSGAGCCCT